MTLSAASSSAAGIAGMEQAALTLLGEILDGYRTGVVGDIDGGWLQDRALGLGLLVQSGSDDDPNYYIADSLSSLLAGLQK